MSSVQQAVSSWGNSRSVRIRCMAIRLDGDEVFRILKFLKGEEMDVSLMAITKMPGVCDLPIRVRNKFAQAIRAEVQGDSAVAAAKLDEAIGIETELVTA